MYSEIAVTTLKNRIGFGIPIASSFQVSIESTLLEGTSGRKLNNFHPLATIENIYASVSEINMESNDFNLFLNELKNQSVLEVVTAIVDRNKLYRDSIDYSNTLIQKASIFDDAIGYLTAKKSLELMISSNRFNLEERSVQQSYQILKVELEGAKNESGFKTAVGLNDKINMAIKSARSILFPVKPYVNSSSNIW